MKLLHLAAVVVLILNNSTASAEFILNGSFEKPMVDVQQFGNGETIGEGWTVLSGGTVYIVNNSINQGSTPFGSQFLEIHGDAITQTIANLTPGNEYEFSYFATAQSNIDYFGTGEILASIAGQTDSFVFTLNGTNSYGSAQLPWTLRSLRFTAGSSSELLTISGSGNSDPLGAIDNVSITAVPEPSSVVLLSFVTSICAWMYSSRIPTERSKAQSATIY